MAPNPASSSTSRAARSATRSLRYWPSLVPASPQSSSPARLTATAVADSWRTSRTSGAVVVGTVADGIRTRCCLTRPGRVTRMAVIDVAGYVAELKDHAVDHGFHVHDERHFVETYSLRQAWEVDLHPEDACNGPLDLHLALEVDPRVLLAFEDVVVDLARRRRAHPTISAFPSPSPGPYPRCPTAPTCCGWPSTWPASAGSSCRWSRLRSTATRRLPTRPSAGSPSWPASRCRWPGCSPARSSCARPSTRPWRSASTCSSGPPPGWAPSGRRLESGNEERRQPGDPGGVRRASRG